MPEETIVLRDAARRLNVAKNPKAVTLAERDLLGLLRVGQRRLAFTCWMNGVD